MTPQHVDLSAALVVRVDRTDQQPPRMLSYSTHSNGVTDVHTTIGLAQREMSRSRTGHRYRGPALVRIWQHRGDEEHYRADVPADAVHHKFDGLPPVVPPVVAAV